MTRAAPAKNRNRSAQTAISSMAAPTGLPALALSSRPSSSALASIASAILSISSERSCGVVFFHDLEGGRGCLDGPIDILGRARRDVGDDLVTGRVDDVCRAAVGRVHELATDELLVRLDSLEGVGHGTASKA